MPPSPASASEDQHGGPQRAQRQPGDHRDDGTDRQPDGRLTQQRADVWRPDPARTCAGRRTTGTRRRRSPRSSPPASGSAASPSRRRRSASTAYAATSEQQPASHRLTPPPDPSPVRPATVDWQDRTETYPEVGPSSHATTSATSSGVPTPAQWVQRRHLGLARRRGRPRPEHARWRSYRSVVMEPSATAFTRMPCGPASTARARVSPSTAALAVAYGSAPRTARWAWWDETLTIDARTPWATQVPDRDGRADHRRRQVRRRSRAAHRSGRRPRSTSSKTAALLTQPASGACRSRPPRPLVADLRVGRAADHRGTPSCGAGDPRRRRPPPRRRPRPAGRRSPGRCRARRR